MVRRLGHYALVERPLVERSLREFYGDYRGGRVETRVAALGQLYRVTRGGHASRRPQEHAAHRISGREAGGGGGHVRCADLRERRVGAAHARTVSFFFSSRRRHT